MDVPGKPGVRCASANIQAASTMKLGLTNSDGWIASGPICSQRCAPLISGPMNSVSTISASATRKAIAATRRIWAVDRQGLLTGDMSGLRDFQVPYARPAGEYPAGEGLAEVVERVRPTVLLGTSTARGAFTEKIVKTMAAGVDRPIVFPISNPTERIEAMPADLIRWTGQPFSYDPMTVADGGGVPLHPGAAKYYRERGYPIKTAAAGE